MRLRPDRRLAIGVALAGAAFLGVYAIPLFFPLPEHVRQFQSNVVYNFAALPPLILAALRTRESRGRERAGWACLTLMLLCWQAADWSYPLFLYVLDRELPAAGPADAAYYAGYVAFAAAIPLLIMRPAEARDPRWLLDAAIVIVVAAVLLSAELLQPISEASDSTRLAILVAMGYPLFDLALVSVLVLSLYAMSGRKSNRVLVLAGAVAVQIAADVAYVWAVANGGYDNALHLMDLGWIGAYALLAVFCAMPAEPEHEAAGARQPGLFEIVAPYCAAVLLAGFTVVATLWSSPPRVLVIGSVGAIVLLSVRQMATMFENLRLYRELQDQMRARSLWLQVQSDLGEAMMIIEGGRFASVNDAASRITGYSEPDLLAVPNVLDLVVPEEREGLVRWFQDRAASTHTSTYHEVTLVRGDGRRVRLELAAMADAGPDDRVLVISRDISERRRAQAALIRSEAVMRGTLESTADGILVVDQKRRIIHNNQRFADMWRIPASVLDSGLSVEMLGHLREQVLDPDAFTERVEAIYAASGEMSDEIRLRDGRIFERYTRPLLEDGRVAGRVWSFRDITERERVARTNRQALIDIAEAKARLEEKSRELATALAAEQERARRDPLTGCLNHGAISSLMHEVVTAKTRRPCAVVMVDVDGMKAINDTFGHLAGDRLLMTVAAALTSGQAEVGRYGGDEFAVLLRGAGRAEAEAYVATVLRALEQTELRDETTDARMPAAISMGAAVFPDDAESVADLVRLADGAMYSSKRSHAPQPEGSIIALRRRDDTAVRLVSELIPLLTSPGALDDKLELISRRLSEAASCDGVRIAIFGGSAPTQSAMTSVTGELPRALTRAWSDNPELQAETPLRALLQETRRPVIIDDVEHDERFSPALRRLIAGSGIHSLIVAPMLWRDQVIGSIGAGRREPGAFTPRDAQLIATIAGQITAIVRMATLVERLQDTSERVQAAQAETVMMLAAAAEAHDRTTGMHLVSIRSLARDLALELGYTEDDATALGLAAVLHDIGKVSVPESVLSSTGPLAPDEWALMRQHTVWGQEFLGSREGFELAALVARSHHERWDGHGYPDGLAGDAIPEAAAIVTVADSFDAMTHDRPYRKRRTCEEAVAEIAAQSGAQFSPRVVDALLSLHARGLLEEAHQHGETKAA